MTNINHQIVLSYSGLGDMSKYCVDKYGDVPNYDVKIYFMRSYHYKQFLWAIEIVHKSRFMAPVP